MFEKRGAGLCKVLLMNLALLLRITVHMGIVELLLDIPVACKLLESIVKNIYTNGIMGVVS